MCLWDLEFLEDPLFEEGLQGEASRPGSSSHHDDDVDDKDCHLQHSPEDLSLSLLETEDDDRHYHALGHCSRTGTPGAVVGVHVHGHSPGKVGIPFDCELKGRGLRLLQKMVFPQLMELR